MSTNFHIFIKNPINYYKLKIIFNVFINLQFTIKLVTHILKMVLINKENILKNLYEYFRSRQKLKEPYN